MNNGVVGVLVRLEGVNKRGESGRVRGGGVFRGAGPDVQLREGGDGASGDE